MEILRRVTGTDDLRHEHGVEPFPRASRWIGVAAFVLLALLPPLWSHLVALFG